MKFILFGAGFWSRYQLAAWQEISGAQCVAVCDPVRERAEELARRFGIAGVYTEPKIALSDRNSLGSLDFVDIVSSPRTHPELVRLALAYNLPTICQKPLAEHLSDAIALAAEARAANIPLLVHENWRWQTPIRALKTALDTGDIGVPFRARLTMVSGFPLFINQPFLKTLERFLLADIGVHVLDTARFLFGEAQSVYCQTRRIQPDIAGEDSATVITRHGDMTVITELGYVQNFYEQDRFPETFLRVEGSKGSLELAPDYWLRVTTESGTHARRVPPPRYGWADPAYEVVHAALVPCLTNLLSGVTGGAAETTAEDNLRTLKMVEAAYESAGRGEVVRI